MTWRASFSLPLCSLSPPILSLFLLPPHAGVRPRRLGLRAPARRPGGGGSADDGHGGVQHAVLPARGRPNAKTRYVVLTLLIPKQHATSDTRTMDEEEGVLGFTEERGLITLGWIHAPFAIVLHVFRRPTHACELPVHAPRVVRGRVRAQVGSKFLLLVLVLIQNGSLITSLSFGIFRLTDPHGLQTVLKCTAKQAFHPHPDVPIYTDADKGHVQMRDAALEIVDLRFLEFLDRCWMADECDSLMRPHGNSLGASDGTHSQSGPYRMRPIYDSMKRKPSATGSKPDSSPPQPEQRYSAAQWRPGDLIWIQGIVIKFRLAWSRLESNSKKSHCPQVQSAPRIRMAFLTSSIQLSSGSSIEC
ncbi:hypothetical protein B0H13DRAFT_1878936 [Mycena leptocephala]|nr:hypothetical protein B0H13DRAFT_1878936 [Mycena leptocephala]